MKRIVLTGGGTAGHVTANLALIPHLMEMGYEVHYIGGKDGMEKGLVAAFPQVAYHGISCGKLRRYFDLKNLIDPFRVIHGIFQSLGLMRKLRPQIVFAKGGFVSVPVAVAGYLSRVPVLLHESDLTMGLANRLCAPFAVAVLTTFPEAAAKLPKGVQTGTPLRPELFSGSRDKGLALCGFSPDRPVLMVTGGSSGAVAVNRLIRESLPELLHRYQVVHLCGKGNLDEGLAHTLGYAQFEYLQGDLPDVFAMADVLISRAGSTTLSEILALKKPALLIPYPSTASRGDQIDNAYNMEQRHLMMALMQEDATRDTLLQKLDELWAGREAMVRNQEQVKDADGTLEVLVQIQKYAKKDESQKA